MIVGHDHGDKPKKTTSFASCRFDIAALREIAGKKVFSCGIAYHEDGQVEILSVDRSRVLARVIESEIYRSELKVRERGFRENASARLSRIGDFAKIWPQRSKLLRPGGHRRDDEQSGTRY